MELTNKRLLERQRLPDQRFRWVGTAALAQKHKLDFQQDMPCNIAGCTSIPGAPFVMEHDKPAQFL